MPVSWIWKKPRHCKKRLNVNEIIGDIIKREGGYVNHPNDKGGATKYGITLKTLSAFRGRECSENEIKKLSKSAAELIYRNEYYKRPGIDRLPQGIQPVVLDMAVNAGPRRAVKILQNTINEFHLLDAELIVDGIIGTKTISACADNINKYGANEVVDFYTENRIKFYKRLAKKDETQKVFLKGWINRANEFHSNPIKEKEQC